MVDPKLYPAQVFYSEPDEGFIATAPDLPGSSAFGETQGQALQQLQDAISAWIDAAQSAGNPVPEPSLPKVDNLPSGKILLRLPRSLHASLIEGAKKDGVSLNSHIVHVITKASSASSSAQEVAHNLIACLLPRSFPTTWEFRSESPINLRQLIVDGANQTEQQLVTVGTTRVSMFPYEPPIARTPRTISSRLF